MSKRIFKWSSLGVFFISIYILINNAKKLNFWDDEVNGFYLSILDSGKKIIKLYSQNIHEDPLLFNYLLHYWLEVFGESAVPARLLSLTFWVVTVLVAYIFVKNVTNNDKYGWIAVFILCILPYHWLYPVAARWYSLSGLLVVANFAFFYKLFLDGSKRSNKEIFYSPFKNGKTYAYLLGYIVSGVLLWYTNYVAPAYFLSALIVVLLTGYSWRRLAKLLVCYTSIFVLYVPWVDTFINQLFISTGGDSATRDIVDFVLSIYVLVAGETSIPQQFYISVPALIGLVAISYLSYLEKEKLKGILTYILVPFLLMSILGVVWTKYMMLFSPLFCILLTLLIYFGLKEGRHKLVAVMIFSLGVAWAGSAVNMFSGENWLASRWLDSYQSVVEEYSSRHEDGFFITNSQSVFYYRGCKHTPLVHGNDKFRSGYYKKCNTTSVDYFLDELLGSNESYSYGKYILVLGGFSSISEEQITDTVQSFKRRGFSVLNNKAIGRDDMLYWKNLVTSRDIPDNRIYVYVMEIEEP